MTVEPMQRLQIYLESEADEALAAEAAREHVSKAEIIRRLVAAHIGLRSQRDAHHAAARELWSATSGALLPTNHVLGETWTFIRRRRATPTPSEFLTP